MTEVRLYVRAGAGRFARWRWRWVWLSQLIWFGLPWLNWNGRQLLRVDLAEQRIYCFGLVLWPQDLILAAGALVAAALALFLASALVGRPWCGYGCPHTVYTTLFMAIEDAIEGGAGARRRNDRAPPTLRRWARKIAKHAAWALLAAALGFVLVGYFTPIRTLAGRAPTALELGWMAGYALLAYVNAGWMREKYCRFVCPYSRFQSVMQDRDTLSVRYDAARGEPRGRRLRGAVPAGQGDCIDCTLCVQVCPTGIDIRLGEQYDCIGCAACIDACDLVMDKIGAPRGLIGYARRV